jgi:O-antigen ligase
MYVAFMVLVCRSATQRQRAHQITSLVIVTMLGLGIILLLARNILISGSIGFAVLFLTLRNSESSRLAKALLLVGGIIVTAVTLLTISGNESWLLDYVGTLATRVSRLLSGRALSSEETLLPRWKEIEYAWLHIASNPILGIGLETAYRPPFYAGDILTAFIHNAYVWIWLKTGLLGLASFLWLSGLSLWRGFRSWRHVQDDLFRAVVLGSTLAYLSMMISNLVAPLFVQDWGLAIFAVMLGTNEVILLNHRVADEQGGAHDTE